MNVRSFGGSKQIPALYTTGARLLFTTRTFIRSPAAPIKVHFIIDLYLKIGQIYDEAGKEVPVELEKESGMCLAQWLMEMKRPLVPQEDNPQVPLFHSVSKAYWASMKSWNI